MDQTESTGTPGASHVVVEIDLAIIGAEALLKTSYWFSRDFVCEIRNRDDKVAEVCLTPRSSMLASDLASVKDAFTTSAMDFALREKIDAKTSGIRDLLLAKAFSESGVLEDQPAGVFGDAVEESKPDGMFRILSDRQS
ncbi:MAG: His-Xaa-Ser system protein HxsD [Terracidiphilus sp.]|jgi:His-Xaa-Ser system protein HxsD